MASHRRPRRPPRRPAPEVRKAPAPIVETHIDRLANSGEGIGQAPDGRTLFVPGTAPGDRVRVRLNDVRRTFARGVLIDVVEAGAERVDPPCPVADTCGGCQWQHLDYPAQVRAKAHIVRDALERIGGRTDIGDVPIESSPEAFGYRGRARVRVERGRPGFRAARSHQHVPIEDCAVLAGPLRAALREFASTHHEDGLWEFALGAPDARHPDGVRVARLGRVQMLVQRFISRVTVNYALLALLQSACFLLLSVHWVACVWGTVATYQDSVGRYSWVDRLERSKGQVQECPGAFARSQGEELKRTAHLEGVKVHLAKSAETSCQARHLSWKAVEIAARCAATFVAILKLIF